MKKKLLYVKYLFWLFVLLFASCQLRSEKHQNLTPVTVGVTAYIGEVASYIAWEQGYFLEEGLDVTIKTNQSGVESISQLFAGEIDIAHAAETPVVFALHDSTFTPEQKEGIQIFANMILASNIQKIIARKSSGIVKPRDLVGKRVGLVKNSQSAYHFDSFLLEYQLKESDTQILNLTPAQQKEAILNGTIDAAVVWEPHASHFIMLLGPDAVEVETSLTYSTLWLAVAMEPWTTDHPDLLVAYLKALRKAQLYVQSNPSVACEIIAQKTETPLEIIQQARTEIDYFLNLSERMFILLEWQQNWVLSNDIHGRKYHDINNHVLYKPMEEAFPEGITLKQ